MCCVLKVWQEVFLTWNSGLFSINEYPMSFCFIHSHCYSLLHKQTKKYRHVDCRSIIMCASMYVILLWLHNLYSIICTIYMCIYCVTINDFEFWISTYLWYDLPPGHALQIIDICTKVMSNIKVNPAYTLPWLLPIMTLYMKLFSKRLYA